MTPSSLVLGWLLGTALAAEPLFAPGAHPALDAQMLRHERQFYAINALPFGLSLDAHPLDPTAQDDIEAFLAQSATDDFEAVTGRHPYEALAAYGEYGDLGFFGGVAVAGTAYAYLTLQREGAPAEEIDRARERVVRAAESLHVFYEVTGGGGVVARGVRRMVSEDPSSPPIPVDLPGLVPLFDATGAPLPAVKDNGTYRPDNSDGSLTPGVWIWKDSCSKDQLIGQIFAMAALYDAMKGDPDIDQALVARLSDDARLVGEMLREKRDISEMEGPTGSGEYDLIIMDADGRPTYHHDLNPKSIEKFYVPEDEPTFNVFNTVMAIGAVRGLVHVSEDPALEAWLYDELLDERGFLDLLSREDGAVDYIYLGSSTNFDNPDMTAVALWLALYTETDPAVAGPLRDFLEDRWWMRRDEPHTAALSKQPLWHAIYLTLTDRGGDPAVRDELEDLLLGFELGPYWNDAVVNCDPDEIAAGVCLAVDGVTEITVDRVNGDEVLATEALHPSIRPPSNFDARSNPFSVNGGGGMRLNPGGDLLAAYWIGRYMQLSDPGSANLSPQARPHMPIGGPVDGIGEDEKRCGCATGPTSGWPWVPLLFLGLRARRARRSPGSRRSG